MPTAAHAEKGHTGFKIAGSAASAARMGPAGPEGAEPTERPPQGRMGAPQGIAVGDEAMSERKARPLPSWWNRPAQHYAGELKMIVEALEAREPDAVARLTLRAVQGDAAAAELLANAFLDGYRVWPSFERARKWLRIAADRGHPGAMRQYARLLLEEDQAREAPDEAAREQLLGYLAGAAEAGDTRALIALGSFKLQLDDADERAAGVRMLERAAGFGHSAAMTRLAQCYQDGNGVERDIETAYAYALLAYAYGAPRGAVSEVCLRSELTDRQIAAAERRAETWRPEVT